MIFQNEVFLIALVGMGLVTLGFIYVIMQAGKPADAAETKQVHKTSNLLRKWLFVALLVIFVGTSYATLHRFPIPIQNDSLQAAQVVNVIGHQWYWEMSATQVETGTPTEFRVTSADVNHGFAIYAPDGRIVVQTQAMPGFVNRILYTFDQPGTYRITCLEYCGLGHHVMATDLTVVAATGGHAS